MSPELRPPDGCLSDLSHRARVLTFVLDETSGALKAIVAAPSACGTATSQFRSFGGPWLSTSLSIISRPSPSLRSELCAVYMATRVLMGLRGLSLQVKSLLIPNAQDVITQQFLIVRRLVEECASNIACVDDALGPPLIVEN